jgi:Tfp pilus assembly protein PilN
MFTIDLLKGRGIPEKSGGPEGVAVAVVGIAVPVIIAIAVFGYYLRGRIIMSVQKQSIINYEAKTNELADVVKLQKKYEEEKNIYNSCLSEVSSSIGRHTPWSPVLVTLIENMPDSIVLTKLDVKQRSVKKKVPQRRPQSNSYEAVKDFQDRLRASTLLGPRLEDITVSQKIDRLNGQNVTSYQINCVFKAGM